MSDLSSSIATISSEYKSFEQEVEKGILGKNTLIPVGFPRINQHIGIGQKLYILVGGESGTGKTALTDEMFVLNPYDWYIANKEDTDKKLRVIYFSMERSKTHKIAKWVCLRLWLKYNILVDVPTILGWREDREPISNEVLEKIKECRDYFEEMLDVVQIKDGAINPTGMYNYCKSISLSEGKLIKSNSKEIRLITKLKSKGELIKEFSGKNYIYNKAGTKVIYEVITINGKEYFIPQYHKEYLPDDENVINVVLGDHNGKWKTERGFNEKQTLDKASEYYGELRDVYRWCVVAVNQFNRNIADSTRRTKMDLSPEKQDFKGSGNMYEDADFVCAIFNPHESNIKDFKNYRIANFKSKKGFSRFRSFHILKNSFGMDNIVTGLNFIGECGHFQEIPLPSQLAPEDYRNFSNPETRPPNPNLKPIILT